MSHDAHEDDELELAVPKPLRKPSPRQPSEPKPNPLAPLPESPGWKERNADAMAQYWALTRIPVLLILGWFTASHLLFGSKWVFIDNVNLVFHEAGHVFFRPFGETAHFLGGTLFQLMVPLIIAAVFWFKHRNRVGVLACAWWFGENFIGIARYMDDAVAQRLPLVGGGIHDWRFLFSKWKVLDKHHQIADTFHTIGAVVMIVTLALLVWLTLRPSEAELEAGFKADEH